MSAPRASFWRSPLRLGLAASVAANLFFAGLLVATVMAPPPERGFGRVMRDASPDLREAAQSVREAHRGERRAHWAAAADAYGAAIDLLGAEPFDQSAFDAAVDAAATARDRARRGRPQMLKALAAALTADQRRELSELLRAQHERRLERWGKRI